MTALVMDEFVENECDLQPHVAEEYESDIPRWCKGCGDHGVLSSVQRLLAENQVDPENLVTVSGIGCSSRFPHYLRSYGFHGIHGRALPISLGVAISRPELKVLTVMGDGDCFSIGAGHWLHTLRYNPDITVLVLDNEVYALTKNQASPTSSAGAVTNTTPHGTYLHPLNPLSVIMGITNVSFLAQTATWLPEHLDDTLKKAWKHKGMSFVRVLQKCPVFTPGVFGGDGSDFSVKFLNNPEGVVVSKGRMKNAPVVLHDHGDINSAQAIAQDTKFAPLGLIYWNPAVPTYGEIRRSYIKETSPKELVPKLESLLDKYAVEVVEAGGGTDAAQRVI